MGTTSLEMRNFPGLGNVVSGKDSASALYNDQFLGGIRLFEHLDTTRAPAMKELSGASVWAVLLRNISGGALTKSTIVRLSTFGSGTFDLIKQVTAVETNADSQICVVVDPWLTTTVADDELFWGIFKGPAKVTYAAAATGVARGGLVGVKASGGMDITSGKQIGYALEQAAAGETKWVMLNIPIFG